MYQFAHEMQVDSNRVGLAYLESCTSIVPAREHADIVTAIAALMRTALDSNDITPLEQIVRSARKRRSDIDELVDAAGHVVIDDLMFSDMPLAQLHSHIAKLSSIEHALCPLVTAVPG
jgi:hypothetical protein